MSSPDPTIAGPSYSTTDSSSSAQDQPPAPKVCAKCSKAETGNEETGYVLKPCITCKSVDYCSRDCKKADMKSHKKFCAGLAQEYSKTAQVKMATRAPPKGGDKSGGLRKWQFDT